MASVLIKDAKSIQFDFPFHTDCPNCPDFMELKKNMTQIEDKTRTQIKLQQIVHILGSSDDVEEARLRVFQLNDNLSQIQKKIEDLEREKVQMARATLRLFQDNMVLLKQDFQTEIKAMNSTFEKISDQVKKLESALIGQDFQESAQYIGDESQEVKSTMTTIQHKVTNTLVNPENLLEHIMTNVISEEIKKLGHALQLDIQNNGTRLKDAFEKMETNTNEISNKIVEAINIKVQEIAENEDVMSDEELENFYMSAEYVNHTKYSGERPLHTASKIGRLDVVKKLIKNGIDVNIKINYNSTPLKLASKFGHKAIVEYLISKNADVNIRDNKNRTALSLAREYGYNEIIEILENHGATT